MNWREAPYSNRVVDGTLQNVRDIMISTIKDDDRLIEILGEPEFLDLTEAQLTHRRGVHTRHNIYLITKFNPAMNDLTRLFVRDVIRLGTIMYEDHQLFYYAQAADYVPFPIESAQDYVPIDFIDRTNAELWAAYGLTIGDAIAPEDAFVVNPADLRRGFRVTGEIIDNSFGGKPFKTTFSGGALHGLLLQRADGSEYIELSFTVSDFARNRTRVVYELGVDENEALAHVKRRNRLSTRPVADALNELLGLPS